MKTYFENEHFIVVAKPAGVLTTPARFADKDPRPVLGLILQEKLKQQIFPVHRLDFEVSGLVLFAKNSQAHAAGNAWFEKKQIQKIYEAYSEGQCDYQLGEKLEWTSKLLRGKKRAYESPVGKQSFTKAQFLGVKAQLLHWYLEPVTGRSHQLRYELAKHNFSILGDKLYGSQKPYKENEIALRAIKILFSEEAQSKWGLPDQLLDSPLDF